MSEHCGHERREMVLYLCMAPSGTVCKDRYDDAGWMCCSGTRRPAQQAPASANEYPNPIKAISEIRWGFEHDILTNHDLADKLDEIESWVKAQQQPPADALAELAEYIQEEIDDCGTEGDTIYSVLCRVREKIAQLLYWSVHDD